MILEGITTKPEVVTQMEVMVGAEFKTSLSIGCSMKEIPTIGQGIVPSFWNSKRKRPEDIDSKHSQRS
jgi:hypothetical protein